MVDYTGNPTGGQATYTAPNMETAPAAATRGQKPNAQTAWQTLMSRYKQRYGEMGQGAGGQVHAMSQPMTTPYAGTPTARPMTAPQQPMQTQPAMAVRQQPPQLPQLQSYQQMTAGQQGYTPPMQKEMARGLEQQGQLTATNPMAQQAAWANLQQVGQGGPSNTTPSQTWNNLVNFERQYRQANNAAGLEQQVQALRMQGRNDEALGLVRNYQAAFEAAVQNQFGMTIQQQMQRAQQEGLNTLPLQPTGQQPAAWQALQQLQQMQNRTQTALPTAAPVTTGSSRGEGLPTAPPAVTGSSRGEGLPTAPPSPTSGMPIPMGPQGITPQQMAQAQQWMQSHPGSTMQQAVNALQAPIQTAPAQATVNQAGGNSKGEPLPSTNTTGATPGQNNEQMPSPAGGSSIGPAVNYGPPSGPSAETGPGGTRGAPPVLPPLPSAAQQPTITPPPAAPSWNPKADPVAQGYINDLMERNPAAGKELLAGQYANFGDFLNAYGKATAMANKMNSQAPAAPPSAPAYTPAPTPIEAQSNRFEYVWDPVKQTMTPRALPSYTAPVPYTNS